MAKNKNGGEGTKGRTDYTANHAIPEGYAEQSGDIVGFWAPELSPTIHFIPTEARAFDSKLEKKKSSVLVLGTLKDAIPLIRNDEEVAGKAGDIVGVWYKPGMKAIRDLAGTPVFMFASGELDTGKPNPMIVFKVFAKSKGQTLLLGEDFRKDSVATELPFKQVHETQLVPAGTQPYSGQF